MRSTFGLFEKGNAVVLRTEDLGTQPPDLEVQVIADEVDIEEKCWTNKIDDVPNGQGHEHRKHRMYNDDAFE